MLKPVTSTISKNIIQFHRRTLIKPNEPLKRGKNIKFAGMRSSHIIKTFPRLGLEDFPSN